MKKIIILLCLLVLSFVTYSQSQYTPMTATGYQEKRLKVDSTLHLPSFCGVPTLRNSTAIQGALAMDTCNNKLYKWTRAVGWSEVAGGGGGSTDTTSLSNRINQKLSISDTAAMLTPYLSKIDTTNKWITNITRIAGNDSIIFYKGSSRFAIKDSVGSGGSSQNGRFGNDTATIVMVKVHNDAGVQLTNGKVVALTTSGNNNEAPAVRLANSKGDSTSANTLGFVSGTINNQDTGWVILSGKIEKLNTAAYSNGDIIYLDTISGNFTKNKPQAPVHLVYLGVVLKSNAGNGAIFVKCQNGAELDEIHDVQINSKVNNQVLAYSDTQKVWKNKNIYSIVDTTTTIATKTNLATKVNISDTANMLSGYAKTSAVNLKVNIADTATMLSKYQRSSDTTAMLSKYQRKAELVPSYALNIGHIAGTFLASTTYYFGMPGIAITSTAAIRRIYIPQSGTIKSAYLYFRATTGTSTENWTISIRLNNTTSTTLATVGNSSLDKVFSNTSLNIAVVAGDYIEIITTTPAWTIPPGSTFAYGSILIQ